MQLLTFSSTASAKISECDPPRPWAVENNLAPENDQRRRSSRGDENVATPQEMARLLEAIYNQKVLNNETTAALIKQLSTLKQSYISRLLPESVQVANKPGELEAVRTDSGIVFAANRPFAISVMTAYDRDERAAERLISEVALEAYRYFEMRGKTSEYGCVEKNR